MKVYESNEALKFIESALLNANVISGTYWPLPNENYRLYWDNPSAVRTVKPIIEFTTKNEMLNWFEANNLKQDIHVKSSRNNCVLDQRDATML